MTHDRSFGSWGRRSQTSIECRLSGSARTKRKRGRESLREPFRTTRAQTSIEFLFLIAFMFVIFIVFFVVIQERTIDLSRAKDYVALKEVNNIVKYEIKNAEFFGNGYFRTFWIPPRISGRTFDAWISYDHAESFFRISGVEYIDFFDVDVYGSFTTGWTDICKKDNTVHMNNCTGLLY